MIRKSSALLLFLFFTCALRAALPSGFYDVTAHGADPTGVADSTAALQAAIDHGVANQLVVWFPPGTYRISDRLVVDQPINTANFPGILMGSTVDAQNRATLYLAPNSPGFNDPANRRVMVHFVNIGSPGSETGATDLYDQAVIGLDFRVGAGNDGAVALRMQGAEGCTIQDVHIDLTEGGHTGIWGPPGSGGSTHRVTVVGGVIGLDTEGLSSGSGTQPTPVVTGSTFINQSLHAVRIRTRGPLVMVGCRFERNIPGAHFQITFNWTGQPFDGSFLLIDSEINYANVDPGNTVIVMGSPRGRSFLFDNVYVRNASHVWTPDAPANPTGWHHFRYLAAEVLPASRSWGQGREFVYIDGSIHGDFYVDAESGVPPPFDLQTRHHWAEDFPTWETPGAVDVTTLGAVGDGTTDNWAVLQQAIHDYEILFFPKGRFAVSNTLDLRPDSKLIGAYITLSSIDALSTLTNRFAGRTESDPDAPIIRTADTADAETWLANIHIRRHYPLAAHNPTTPGNYALEWRSGGNSVLRHVKLESRPDTNHRPDFVARLYYGYNTDDPDAPDYNPINPNHPQADFLPGDWAWSAAEPNVQVRGNGGGRWFNFWFHGRQHLRQETPFLRVEGTSQPLHIYHLHMQQEDSRNHAEFLNAANVSIYGTKGEVKGAMVYFESCDNVRLFGNGGLTSPDANYFDPYLFRFINCTNFLIAGMADTIQEGASQWIGAIFDRWMHANLLTWQTIQDAHPLRGEVIVPSTHRPILYKVGEPSGESLGGLSLSVVIAAPATGTTVTQGTYVTFEGSAADENEGDLSATAAWTSSIDGLIGFGPSLTTGSLSPGNHTITLSAKNALSGFAARAIELTVLAGGQELLVTVSAEADTYVRAGSESNNNFGASTTLRSRGVEPSESLYRFNLAGLNGEVTAATLTLTLAAHDTGNLHIHDVEDTTWEEMTVTYNTRPALAPAFTTVAVGGGMGTPHMIDVTASVAAAPAAGKVSFGTSTTGSLIIRMRSRESTNSADHPRLSVTTVTETLPIPPSAAITAPANDTLHWTGALIGFTATATDAASNDLAASGQWSSSIDGSLGTGASLSTDALSPGVHVITFSIEDADELSAFAQILVRVEEEPPPPNQPPVATITSPAANVFTIVGEPILLEGTVMDPEDGDLTASATWTSSLEGFLGSGASLSPTLSLGLHVITLSATDSDGASGSATRLVEVMVAPEPTATLFSQNFSTSGLVADYQGSGPHLFDSISTAAPAQNRTALSIADGRLQGVVEYLDDGTTDQFSTARLTRNTDLPTEEQFIVLSLTARVALDDPTAANIGLFGFDLGSNFRTGAFNPAGGSGNGPAFLQAALEKLVEDNAFRFTGAGGTGGTFTVIPQEGTHRFDIVIAANKGSESRLVASPTGTHILEPGRFSLWVNGVLYHDNATEGINTAAGLTHFSVAFGSGQARSYASGLPWNGVYDFDDIVVTTLQSGAPNTPPAVTITSPADAATFTEGVAIDFTGTATDAEDGELSASATWTSSIDGALGTGAAVTVSTLSVGTHTITFAATDSGGLSDSDQIVLSVEVAPPPTYTVNFSAGTGGSLSGTTGQTVNSGDSTTEVIAVPDSGYTFLNWTWTGGNSSTANPLTISNVTADLTVTAHFEEDGPPETPSTTFNGGAQSDALGWADNWSNGFPAPGNPGVIDKNALYNWRMNTQGTDWVVSFTGGAIELNGTNARLLGASDWTMSGGSFSATTSHDLQVEGESTFHLMAGAVSAHNLRVIGAGSTFNQSGGTLTMNNNLVGGSLGSTFNQIGGTASFASLVVNSSALNLSGGSFTLTNLGTNNIQRLTIGGSAQITLHSGSVIALERFNFQNNWLANGTTATITVQGWDTSDFASLFTSGRMQFDGATLNATEFGDLFQVEGSTLSLISAGGGETDPYEDWAAANGLVGGDAHPEADPDNDGIPNLLEYALGGDPTVPGRSHLPVLGQTDVGGSPRLTLTFNRVDDPDLIYAVWAGEDLDDWGAEPIWTSTGAAIGGGEATVVDTASITPGQPRFLRLTVTR